MSSPVRWKDEGSAATPELREIMRHAQQQVPNAAQVETLTASVLSQLTPPTQGATGAGTVQGGTLAASAKLLVIALLGGALGATAWWMLPDRTRRAETKPTGAAVAEVVRAPSTSPSAMSKSEPEAAHPASAALPERTMPTAKTVHATHARPAAQSTRTGGGRELALLHAARSARRRAPGEALAILRQHERDFPQSGFTEEREALLIELLLYFDPPEATRRLAAFELRYPHSPYRARLQKGP